MSPLFSRKPKLHNCFFCSEAVENSAKTEHYKTHLIEVTDNNGQRAFTFECPRCGMMDQAWGGGRPDPEGNGVNAIYVHLLQHHNLNLIV